MKYYILSVESYINAFSYMNTESGLKYLYEKQENSIEFDKLRLAEKVFIYKREPQGYINILLEIAGIDKNKVQFNKLLEINNGITKEECLVNADFDNVELLEISKNTFDFIYERLVSKINIFENVRAEITKEEIQKVGKNIIFYGIPGCGKSYKVSAMLKHHPDFIEEAKSHGIMKPIKNEYIFRTTFYLDYSNSDFIGQIYPKVTSGEVTYEAIPGPFTKALVKAYDNPEEMVYLVIEEINRGNAAAIFGDTFQLLDRLKANSNGRLVGSSEYSIFNSFIEGYIVKINEERKENKQKLIPYTEGCIYIPNNLTIFATMNTSDQNVFPLDTAFKRRWERERVNCNWEKKEFKNKYIPYTDISWYDFGNNVNKLIVSNTSDGITTEDKQIGPYFISMDMLTDQKNVQDKNKLDRFVNNVIDYLFNDVSKFNHEIIFNKKIKSFDAIEDIIEEDLKNYDQIKDQILKNVLNIDFYKKQLEGSDGQEE